MLGRSRREAVSFIERYSQRYYTKRQYEHTENSDPYLESTCNHISYDPTFDDNDMQSVMWTLSIKSSSKGV